MKRRGVLVDDASERLCIALFQVFPLVKSYREIYDNDADPFVSRRLTQAGLNRTSLLISLMGYHRLIVHFLDQELLSSKAIDFSQRVYAMVS